MNKEDAVVLFTNETDLNPQGKEELSENAKSS
jgi:hypothetical protein